MSAYYYSTNNKCSLPHGSRHLAGRRPWHRRAAGTSAAATRGGTWACRDM